MKKIFELLTSKAVRAAFVLIIGLLKSILNAIANLRDLIDDGEINDSVDNAMLNRVLVILDQIGSTSILALNDFTEIINLFKKDNPKADVVS